jgi:hypothetical protein
VCVFTSFLMYLITSDDVIVRITIPLLMSTVTAIALNYTTLKINTVLF